MEQILKRAKDQFEEVISFVQKELGALRAGKATPALVEDIMAEAYGTKMPIKQLAGISLQDARTIVIEPWDATVLQAVERAVAGAGALGLSPATRGEKIFVTIPPLTEDRRKDLAKAVSAKREEARIRVRRIREDAWNAIQEKEKAGDIREDEKFKAKDRLQQLVDDVNKKLEDLAAQKEREIMEV